MKQEETGYAEGGEPAVLYFGTYHLGQSQETWPPASAPGSSPGSSLYRANAGRVGTGPPHQEGPVGTPSRSVPGLPSDQFCVSDQLEAAP